MSINSKIKNKLPNRKFWCPNRPDSLWFADWQADWPQQTSWALSTNALSDWGKSPRWHAICQLASRSRPRSYTADLSSWCRIADRAACKSPESAGSSRYVGSRSASIDWQYGSWDAWSPTWSRASRPRCPTSRVCLGSRVVCPRWVVAARPMLLPLSMLPITNRRPLLPLLRYSARLLCPITLCRALSSGGFALWACGSCHRSMSIFLFLIKQKKVLIL